MALAVINGFMAQLLKILAVPAQKSAREAGLASVLGLGSGFSVHAEI